MAHRQVGWLLLSFSILSIFSPQLAHGASKPTRPLSHPQCTQCPPGFGVKRPCGPRRDTTCVPCVEGTSFSATPSGQAVCRPCSRCGEGLFELHPCKATSDVFCEVCSWTQAPDNPDYMKKCFPGSEKFDSATKESGVGVIIKPGRVNVSQARRQPGYKESESGRLGDVMLGDAPLWPDVGLLVTSDYRPDDVAAYKPTDGSPVVTSKTLSHGSPLTNQPLLLSQTVEAVDLSVAMSTDRQPEGMVTNRDLHNIHKLNGSRIKQDTETNITVRNGVDITVGSMVKDDAFTYVVGETNRDTDQEQLTTKSHIGDPQRSETAPTLTRTRPVSTAEAMDGMTGNAVWREETALVTADGNPSSRKAVGATEKANSRTSDRPSDESVTEGSHFLHVTPRVIVVQSKISVFAVCITALTSGVVFFALGFFCQRFRPKQYKDDMFSISQEYYKPASLPRPIYQPRHTNHYEMVPMSAEVRGLTGLEKTVPLLDSGADKLYKDTHEEAVWIEA